MSSVLFPARRNRVLLVVRDSREAIRLSSLLGEKGNSTVHVVDDLDAAERLRNKKYGIDLMIVRDHRVQFTGPVPEQVIQFARSFPTLFLSEHISEAAVHRARLEENIRFMHMPLPDDVLVEMTKKLASGEKFDQQIYKRYATDNIAELEVYGSGSVGRAFLRNLSRSGAFLQFEPRMIDFECGDLLQMTVKLDKMKTERTVSAEVVWVKTSGNDLKGMGINFIHGDEVFNKLLARI